MNGKAPLCVLSAVFDPATHEPRFGNLAVVL